ncbi:MAG: 7,8-didemethyl-8-hydroxy-5-deazariboflavin synthase, partial [Actinobacteria bacterium]|nr:7,8-didemethyl-8-hydroxy-5-deazariboflavin synthase [Actinomycetota bacterium]
MKKFGRALSKYFVNAHRRVKLSESRRVSTQLSPSSNSSLIAQSASELMPLARKIRDQAFGSRITFSPKVFIPLTMLCRDKCGYCTFAQPPARLENPYLSPDQVLEIAKQGAKVGCHEALFTLGERPELRYEIAKDWLKQNKYDSTVHYLHDMAALVLRET